MLTYLEELVFLDLINTSGTKAFAGVLDHKPADEVLHLWRQAVGQLGIVLQDAPRHLCLSVLVSILRREWGGSRHEFIGQDTQ